MAKTLRFEIDTDASYTTDELESLQDDFVAWITDLDGDSDADTVDVKIVRAADADIDTEAISNFIKQGGEVEYEVKIRLKDSDGVTGTVVSGVGNLS